MGKKLSFLLTSKPWKSALLNSVLFGIGLLGLWFFDFSFFASAAFFLLILVLYLFQLPERHYFRISYLILSLASFLALRFFEGNFYPAAFASFAFGFLSYLIFGLVNLIFENRKSVYLFLNTCLLLAVSLIVFAADKSKYFFIINVLLFLAVFLLFEGCFNFLRSAGRNSLLAFHNSRFVSFVFAFLGLELFWTISLLPIGFINSAVLLTLFLFLTRDFTLSYFSGLLNRRFLINNFFVFIFLAVFVFINSKWGI